MVVLGYDDTLQVTIDDMAHHTAAVARARPDAVDRRRPAVDELPRDPRGHGAQRRHADPGRRAGRQARGRPQARRRSSSASSTPRSRSWATSASPRSPSTPWAASRSRARPLEAARALVDDAKALADPPACSSSCSRACPTSWPTWSPSAIDVPTIGIGAGAATATARCSCSTTSSASRTASPRSSCAATPQLGADAVEALRAYAADVRAGRFPNDDESYHVKSEVAETLSLYGAS